MTTTTFRRVVTGHNAEGKAVILEDSAPPRTQRVGGEIGPMFYEIWNTRATPAPIDRTSGEPFEKGIVLAPPKNGTRIRVLEIPPEDDRLKSLSPEAARAHFAEIGAADASSHRCCRLAPRLHASHRDHRLWNHVGGRADSHHGYWRDHRSSRRYRHPARHQSRLGQPFGEAMSDRICSDRRGVYRRLVVLIARILDRA